MTEVAPASEDSSSSSSYAPLGGFNNNNNNYSSTIINTPFSSPQSQQQPSSSSTTSSSASTTTTASRKPRRFLQQKLDIPPRQFDQVNQVSVVKMSDKLTSTTTTTNNNNNNNTTNKVSTASSLCASTLLSVASANGNQKQVSPNSCLSLASSATTSPSLASRSNSHNNNNHSTNSDSAKTSPFFNCSSAASSCYSSSSSQMQESGGRTLSNISSIPSSLPSPQVTSANNVPQFGGSNDTSKTTQQQETQEDNEDNKDTFSPTSGHFTASLVHPNIYLGAAIDANSAAELIARGIFFILNVAYECDFADSVMNCPQIQKKKINLRDTVQENIEPSFEEAFSFIDAAIEQNKKILVHCFMGASRSATIVIAYIMRKLAEKDLCEQVFVATRSSIISKHQQYEREETNKSPTMIDTLRIFPPPPTAASAITVPSTSTTTSVQAFPPTTSAAIENQQQQQQQQQQQNQTVSFPVITTTTSDNSNSSSTSSSSYYFTALDQVQKVRPEILPNLAFCTALHKMDDELMLRSTAVVC